MSNTTPDYPDFQSGIVTPAKNLLNVTNDAWTTQHTYGPFYVGDSRSIMVVWQELTTGHLRTIDVLWLDSLLATAALANPILANDGTLISATLPVLGQAVSLQLTGGTVPNPTATALRLDAYRAEGVQEFAVSDLVMCFHKETALAVNTPVIVELFPIIPGAATISSFCVNGAHRIEVQFMDNTGNWQPCGGVGPSVPDGVFTAALPSRPCRLVGVNLSGAASDFYLTAVHVAHQ